MSVLFDLETNYYRCFKTPERVVVGKSGYAYARHFSAVAMYAISRQENFQSSLSTDLFRDEVYFRQNSSHIGFVYFLIDL